MRQKIHNLLMTFKDVIFPLRCLSCKSPFSRRRYLHGNSFEDNMRPYLCRKCITAYTKITSPKCSSCGIMFNERISEDHLCGTCIKKRPAVRMARSFGVYDKSVLSIIKAYKFKRKIQLAGPLGSILHQLLRATYHDCNSGEWFPDSPDIILPVPLHKKRFRKRKFNQAWLMIRNWNDSRVCNSVLFRTRATRPQTGLDKKTRQKNIRGAFSVSAPDKIKGKKILLIDDVFTTGATVNECARELLKNGAHHVDVLTIARTQVI